MVILAILPADMIQAKGMCSGDIANPGNRGNEGKGGCSGDPGDPHSRGLGFTAVELTALVKCSLGGAFLQSVDLVLLQ